MNKKYLPLLFIVTVFIIVKIPHLTLPHYWDESWSYATAVQLMYEKDITLLPGSIDVEATRGHPLLFYAAASSWMLIFGASLVSKHAFALLLSVLLLITVYHVCLQLGNLRRAVITTVLFAAQVFFFVQSSMLLPEVMITLLFFAAIYFYTVERYVMLTITLSMLFLTKESGLVAGLVLGLLYIGSWISGNLSPSSRKKLFVALLIPLLVIVTFFIIQKLHYGWFFFPEHIGFIDGSLNDFSKRFQMSLFILFMHDERQWLWLLISVLSVFYALQRRQPEWFLYIAGIVLIFAFKYLPLGFSQSPLVIIPFILYLIFICVRRWLRLPAEAKQEQFLLSAMLFCIAYLVFCSFNFYTARYLMPVLLFSLVLYSIWADTIFSNLLSLKLYWPFAAAVTGITLLSYFRNDNTGDTGLGAYQALKVQRDIVHFFTENKQAPATPISLCSFQQTTNLKNKACGFIPDSSATFTDIQWAIEPRTRYVIFDNIEPDYRYDEVRMDPDFTLVYQTKHGKLWGKIYKKK